ncbi:prolipoprotein diacylglyceryl transferase [Sphingomonas sp. Leaf4]|uniref:prolipoprotein diacylglyceryl transferase n=1 Tax=Sphingomonas sp. Leaf4 TaxID=2876553 RepID=UPI001E47EF5B|nr:prolipoprotein diacylglyceryl transferase [Sphingomonas sp. Leaf4]
MRDGGESGEVAMTGDATAALRWQDLGLSPVAFDLGPLPVRWYALAFLATFLLGGWYLRRLLREPGAPMRPELVDDLFLYAVAGVILGGRLGYATFYQPGLWAAPLELVQPWHGGMSFHGGLIGLLIGLTLFARNHGVPLLRLLDYVGCATPFGMILVRLANFVNGELWGRPTTLPWGMVFPGAGDGVPRHPSQLYEALLEGVVMLLLLGFLFWRTGARHVPGRLAGAGLTWYAVARFSLEWVRQPDRGLEHLSWGLTMGQTLSVPILFGGLALLILPPRIGTVRHPAGA